MKSDKITGVLLIILGLKVLFIQDSSRNWSSYTFSDSFLYIPASLLLFYLGYLLFKIKPLIKLEKYTICPSCNETYNYEDLENGLCPKCNIKTKDLDGYYDDKKSD